MLQFVRSVLFNIAFFLGSTVMCVGLIWTLILPRKPATFFYNLYFRIVYLFQRLILGIKYDIKGLENLPTDRNYIIASKHQSASETMLFPLILKDPAIILKKELLQIPLWGWYAKKAGMIGIDRSAREKALKLMIDGAEKVFAENRPIIVFPQGTRTSVDDQTNQPSYKRGILRLYNNLDCPVVPVALNTGVFWGKNKFFKRAGRATIEFLPPIEQGLSPTEFMSTLQERIEPRSDELVQDAFDEYKARKSFRAIQDIVFFFVTICVLWTAYWTYCARQVEHAMLDIRTDMQQAPIAITYDDAQISGFPFHVRLSLENVKMHAPTMTVTIPELKAHAVPLPHRSLFIESFAPITLSPLTKEDLGDDLVIDHLRAEVANMFSITPMTEQNNELGYRLKSLEIAMGDFRIHAQGHVVQDLDTAAHNGELIFILD